MVDKLEGVRAHKPRGPLQSPELNRWARRSSEQAGSRRGKPSVLSAHPASTPQPPHRLGVKRDEHHQQRRWISEQHCGPK